MSRYLGELHRAFKLKFLRLFFQGGEKRQLQERADIHRLYLFTSLHEQKHLLDGQIPDGFAEHIVQQANDTAYEEQRDFVQQRLRSQLVDIASSIHTCLVKAQDPRPSGTAFEQAWQQQCNPASSSSSSGGGVSWSSGNALPAAAAAAAMPNASAGQQQVLGQHDLSHMLQQQLGFSLSVRPSLVRHQEAGLGLFVEGTVAPGSLVALFPGLVYQKQNYRRIPGYPRMDVGNPYLTARYDGGIIDSKPWGQGWLADPSQALPIERPLVIPPARGMLGRYITASDGPRVPVPETTQWINPTSGEAAFLELLEGRHPLALAHFANHPPAGAVPNTVIANFKFRLQLTKDFSNGSSGSSTGRSSSSGSGSSSDEAWMRAYVPNLEYCVECNHHQVLSKEVSCVGLVAVQPISPGSEVLFNYRLSPALRGRPSWYVPVNAAEENMRWA